MEVEKILVLYEKSIENYIWHNPLIGDDELALTLLYI